MVLQIHSARVTAPYLRGCLLMSCLRLYLPGLKGDCTSMLQHAAAFPLCRCAGLHAAPPGGALPPPAAAAASRGGRGGPKSR